MCPSCMSWKRSWTSIGGSHFKQMERWRRNQQQVEEQHLNKSGSTKNSVTMFVEDLDTIFKQKQRKHMAFPVT